MTYHDNFEPDSFGTGIEKMASAFDEPLATFDGCEIIFAVYETPDYDGWAFVLFTKDGALYEVNGSHCSCYGLDGQWEPEEVNVEELIQRTTTTATYGPVAEFKEQIVEKVQALFPEVYGPEPFSLYEFFHEC